MSGDDQALIAECLRGRAEAFGELVSRYQDRLYNSLLRIVDHAEDARDVVQEAFLNAYQSLASFKGDSLFFTWLYRIGVNTAISAKRRQKHHLRLHVSGDESPVEPADRSSTAQPDSQLAMDEEQKRVHDALARLSPEHRAVLIMKDMEDQRYEEIAAALAVPIGTVRSRLHRARLELRDLLSER